MRLIFIIQMIKTLGTGRLFSAITIIHRRQQGLLFFTTIIYTLVTTITVFCCLLVDWELRYNLFNVAQINVIITNRRELL